MAAKIAELALTISLVHEIRDDGIPLSAISPVPSPE